MRTFIKFSLFLLLLVGCTSTGSQLKNTSARCIPASNAQMEQLRFGVKQEQESNDVQNGWAIKSNDYENVYFVAAEITGPNIGPKEAVGIWALGGEPDAPNLTLSVDGFAKEFSYWIYGPDTEAKVSQFDDGAQEAKECVMSH